MFIFFSSFWSCTNYCYFWVVFLSTFFSEITKNVLVYFILVIIVYQKMLSQDPYPPWSHFQICIWFTFVIGYHQVFKEQMKPFNKINVSIDCILLSPFFLNCTQIHKVIYLVAIDFMTFKSNFIYQVKFPLFGYVYFFFKHF